jgi:eukaryotic-like serine/threonine-protein kinase
MPLNAGTRLGRYEVRTQIGAGGMGDVYLAQDLNLRRSVALKLLPAEYTQDEGRLRRFEQEACAASGLNHPNILTIHEIGAEGEAHFIATEFIDGESLRLRMTRGDMKLREMLDIVIQVAAALTAAHEAGIVHRDIKPENIMVRHDGYVKVLDFGLAKLIERRITDSEASTMVNTDPGVVMGTASYMSPEQARGIDVDARTDIWSLGVVIYEMIAGRVPFEGTTTGDMLSLILGERNAPPLARFARDVPSELERIVTKALTKERGERYQTARDLLIDLKRLKQQLDVEAEIERTTAPEFAAGATGTGDKSAAVQTMGQPAPASTSNAQHIAGEIARNKLGIGIAAVVLLAIAAFAYFAYFARRDGGSAREAITSIAVLPFVNASNNPEAEYLSDGISESLINTLSQVPNLRVVPRSTVFRYKGRDIDPQTIGRELGVRAVLTGKLVQRGDTLSIQTELIDVAEESQLWGEQYNRKLADLLAVQEEISREISEKLRIRLSGEERKQLAKRYTENTEAYQLYLKGRYHWNKRTPEDLKKGIGYFQQAIDIDPNYALAFAGLADSYIIFGNFGLLPPKEVYPKARGAAQKALEIDGNLAEAQVSLAFVKALFEWDWQGADAGFKRAIELNPNYGPAHQWYGVYLAGAGRLTEAVAEAQRAQEVDPLSLTINSVVGWMLYFDRQYDRAIEQENKTLEMDPNFVLSYRYRGMAYEQKGMYPEAIADLQKAVTLSGARTTSSLGHAYAIAGRRSEARKVLDEAMQLRAQEYLPSYEIAIIYTGMGEKDQAFEWLDKAYEERSPWLIHIRVDPRFETLHSDARFADLVRRVGLPL